MFKIHDKIPLEKLVSRQVGLWDTTQPKKSAEKGSHQPVLTISKKIGSMGIEIAENIAKRLQWKFFDKDIVDHIANNAQVRRSMVERLDEKVQSEIHNWVATLLDSNALALDKYFKQLVTVVTTISKHGNSVVVGRGGNFIVPEASSLRVNIIAPLDVRIRRVASSEKISQEMAQSIILTSDKSRALFIKRNFHKDPEDPLFYDLVLNTETLTLSEAESIIIHALESKFLGCIK